MANYLAPDPIQSTFFIPGGNTPGNGVQLFMYAAGTNTKQTVYQGATTSTPWANPIVLDSGGNIPSGSKQVWLVGGTPYKAVYAPSNDTDPPISPYLTLDNLSGVNDPSGISANSEWAVGTTPTFISATQFTVVGDQTTTYTKGRRIKATVTAGTVYATVTNVVFAAITTVTLSGGALDSGLSVVSYGLLDPANPSISFYEVSRKSTSTVSSAATTNIWAVDGDFSHITGSTGPIVSFGTAAYAGAERTVIFDSTPTITNNATTLALPGAANIVAAPGDRAIVRADTTSNMIVVSYERAASVPLVYATTSETFTGTETAKAVTPAGLNSVLGLTKLTSGTVSSSATLDIVMTSYTFYRNKQLILTNIIPVTDGVVLNMRVSTDGGSTYDASASDYGAEVYIGGVATAANDSAIPISGTGLIGNANTEGLAATIVLYNMSSAALWQRVSWTGTYVDSAGAPVVRSVIGSGARRAAQDTDAVRFLFTGGNISTGSWALYGFNQ